jgi:DNA-binding NtrC family response regulator
VRVKTKANVLVSESDPDVRRLLVLLVEKLGHGAIVAGSGSVPPTADLMLLEPESAVCLEQARLARLDSPELRVVSFGLVPPQGRFLADGPLEYLPKPFTIERLREVVARALG